jgi:hypothetical protein
MMDKSQDDDTRDAPKPMEAYSAASNRRGGYQRQGVGEAMLKSLIRSIASSIGRTIVRTITRRLR